MKALVLRSIEDEGGQRCVDLRREADGSFAWVECRRDPEDAHGWRLLGLGAGGFSGEAEALADARASVAWMEDR